MPRPIWLLKRVKSWHVCRGDAPGDFRRCFWKWPRAGRFLFRSGCLHPSSALLIWFVALLAIQSLGHFALGIGLLLLSLVPGVHRQWFGFVRRARWLLLTLWLIMAYHTPGEAFHDIAWAPTYEGIAEANVHALRLVLMLGALAWLFVRLGRDGLLAGLWGLLQCLRKSGFDVERLVVRLSLVLAGLQQPGPTAHWRQMLLTPPDLSTGPASVSVAVVAWQRRDTLYVLAAMLLAGGLWW